MKTSSANLINLLSTQNVRQYHYRVLFIGFFLLSCPTYKLLPEPRGRGFNSRISKAYVLAEDLASFFHILVFDNLKILQLERKFECL